ncbi:hypothetical protein WJX73_005854 [Symbiochloris irregularis]|uniref:Uncharacterized protein n=1 Tax=Symbiochloris irregularis TaxID=706552 RepID=A0AAW1NQ41_9CHLO
MRYWTGVCRGAMLNQDTAGGGVDASSAHRPTTVADGELQSMLGSKLRLNSTELQRTDRPALSAEPCELGLHQSPATRREQAKRALTAHTSEDKAAANFDAAMQVSDSEDRRVPCTSNPTHRQHDKSHDRAPLRPVRAPLRRQKGSLNLQSYTKDIGVNSKPMKYVSSHHQRKASG